MFCKTKGFYLSTGFQKKPFISVMEELLAFCSAMGTCAVRQSFQYRNTLAFLRFLWPSTEMFVASGIRIRTLVVYFDRSSESFLSSASLLALIKLIYKRALVLII